MNTTQNIQRITAGLITASVGLALASCAGQIPDAGSDRISAQVAEQRAAYRDLAERRAELSQEGGPAKGQVYRDQAERRVGVGGPAPEQDYRDLAERRVGVGGPAPEQDYRDLAERRLGGAGH